MDSLTHLYPEAVWTYFGEICQIPRPSKKEEQIIAYVMDFAHKHNLEAEKDAAGNILIKKPATAGLENKKTVILQSHLDMVGEKNSDVSHNFDTDPIRPYIDGNWVKAEGTTLGADDGIGVAAMLAILAADDLAHPALECLFTIDEETGMTGAIALQPGWLKGEILINLDSEDWEEIFIGSAGGKDTVAHFAVETEAAPAGYQAFELKVTGLNGGHSGDEIDKGLGNSIKVINRILWKGTRKHQMRLSSLEGGNKRNAIPREAFATVLVPENQAEAFKDMATAMAAAIQKELASTENRLQFAIEPADAPAEVLTADLSRRLIDALYACPHGVYEMSREMEGIVETSTNLASVKRIANFMEITTSQRSSVESAKEDIANMVATVFQLAGAQTEHGDGYPGWKPNPDSEIVRTSVESYKRLFKKEPVVRAIHAGLECGMFLDKYPQLDMVSIGPDLKGAHTPEERIDIKTTGEFWDFLLDILKNSPEK